MSTWVSVDRGSYRLQAAWAIQSTSPNQWAPSNHAATDVTNGVRGFRHSVRRWSFQRLHWPAGSASRRAASQLAISVTSCVPSAKEPEPERGCAATATAITPRGVGSTHWTYLRLHPLGCLPEYNCCSTVPGRIHGGRMSRLFLSHSSTDNAKAVALCDWLDAEGWHDVFLDLDPERGIAAGERWEQALLEAASRCEAVLFLISQAWLESRWCLREFMLAQQLNKRLFGVLIEQLDVADLPADLHATWQVVNLASGHDHRQFTVTLPQTQQEFCVNFSRESLARLRAGLIKAGLDPRFFDWPPKTDPNRPPYRGLLPLEAEDAGIFFGRDSAISTQLTNCVGCAPQCRHDSL